MENNKLAWRIYYDIYGDKKNREGLYRATKSQELIREHLEGKNGWSVYDNQAKLIEKIKSKVQSDEDARKIIYLISKHRWSEVEELLTK